ncbi:MAG: Rv0518 family GDSL lipase [Mycobacterium sp.]
MSRLLTVTLCLCVLFGALHAAVPANQHHDVRLMDYAVNRIAVIGDSYTSGSDEGGAGTKGWPTRVWRSLAHQGIAVTPTVAAEPGAGYGTRGDRGSLFEDLTVRAVKPNDVLVVFFGSHNDLHVDLTRLSVVMYGTLRLARQIARSAKFLVIGPAWPTADPPLAIRRIRDVLSYQAKLAKANFVDPLAARWFGGTSDLISEDGIHPTDAGHAYMAQKLAPLIGAQLNPY